MNESNCEVSTATEQMREFIHEHLQDAITASDIAKAAGYSQYHASRIFKDKMGISPFEYIRRERLLQSARAGIAKWKNKSTGCCIGLCF